MVMHTNYKKKQSANFLCAFLCKGKGQTIMAHKGKKKDLCIDLVLYVSHKKQMFIHLTKTCIKTPLTRVNRHIQVEQSM